MVHSFLTTNTTLRLEKGQALILLAKYLSFSHCSFQMSFDFNEINRNTHVFSFRNIFFQWHEISLLIWIICIKLLLLHQWDLGCPGWSVRHYVHVFLGTDIFCLGLLKLLNVLQKSFALSLLPEHQRKHWVLPMAFV